MSAYRDRCNPLEPHTVVLDRVRLEFGEDGLLRNPDAAERATMKATPLRCERFTEVADSAPETAEAEPAAAPAAAAAAAPVDAAADTGTDDSARRSRKPRQGTDA